jgi:hypothetical protein
MLLVMLLLMSLRRVAVLVACAERGEGEEGSGEREGAEFKGHIISF